MGTDRAEGWGGDKRMKIEYTHACRRYWQRSRAVPRIGQISVSLGRGSHFLWLGVRRLRKMEMTFADLM